MTTLREDVIEARDRADVARKSLAAKLAKNSAWSRNEQIEALDGLDSLVSMANEVLPYIPLNVVGAPNPNPEHSDPEHPNMNVGRTTWPSWSVEPVRPGQKWEDTYSVRLKYADNAGHQMYSYAGVQVADHEGDLVVLRSPDKRVVGAHHASGVLGLWFDVPASKGLDPNLPWLVEWSQFGFPQEKKIQDDTIHTSQIQLDPEKKYWGMVQLVGEPGAYESKVTGWLRVDAVRRLAKGSAGGK